MKAPDCGFDAGREVMQIFNSMLFVGAPNDRGFSTGFVAVCDLAGVR